MLLFANLGPAARTASALFLALAVAGSAGAYASYRRPDSVRRLASGGLRLLARAVGGGRRLSRAEEWSARRIDGLREEFREAGRQLGGRPWKTFGFGALALGYWGFDALCMVLVSAAWA